MHSTDMYYTFNGVFTDVDIEELRHQENNKTMKRRRIKIHFYILSYNGIKVLDMVVRLFSIFWFNKPTKIHDLLL